MSTKKMIVRGRGVHPGSGLGAGAARSPRRQAGSGDGVQATRRQADRAALRRRGYSCTMVPPQLEPLPAVQA